MKPMDVRGFAKNFLEAGQNMTLERLIDALRMCQVQTFEACVMGLEGAGFAHLAGGAAWLRRHSEAEGWFPFIDEAVQATSVVEKQPR